jgi:small ubiquitin-related modifier
LKYFEVLLKYLLRSTTPATKQTIYFRYFVSFAASKERIKMPSTESSRKKLTAAAVAHDSEPESWWTLSFLEGKLPSKKRRGDDDGSLLRGYRNTTSTTNRAGGNGSDGVENEHDCNIKANLNNSNCVILPARDNEFTEETWWTVDAGFDGKQGASAVVARCVTLYGWSDPKARKVLKAYRQFLTLKKESKDWDATILSPSALVDQMWHAHVLDTKNYFHDMMLLCGNVVNHNPDGGHDKEAREARRKTTRDALLNRFGSYTIDSEIWRGFHIDGEDPVTVVVKDGRDGVPVTFEIKPSMKMRQIFEIFARKQNVNVAHVHLMYRGRPITKTDTPESLRIKNHTPPTEINALITDAEIIPLDSPQPIVISIRDQSGEEIYFKIKKTTPLSRVYESYASRKGVDAKDLRFIFDGTRIDSTETAESIKLEDQDRLYCMSVLSGC